MPILKRVTTTRDGLDSAAKLQCPALFVLGRKDMMTPVRAARKLIDAVPKSQTVILDNCGHMMPMEKPDETLDALVGFFT